jgi:PPOX class probable F420-dependent enzyme
VSDVALDEVEDQLDAAEIGWLTTVSGDGQPQTSVVWFLRHGNAILIYSRPSTAKVRNIQGNPKVAFTLQSDAQGDRVATMEGNAIVESDPTPANEVPSYVEKYREPISRNGWTPDSFATDYSTLVTVTITRLRAF